MADQSVAVYRAEYAQIIHGFLTLTRTDCEKFVRPMPTSLVRPEMVYPGKKYEAYCLKVPESGPVVQYEPISDYKMDGLQPRIDLRPGTEIPIYPEDEVDADPRFNEYPPYEEFVEGPEWTPGGIPPKIHSLEYSGNTSDTSIDTQVGRTIWAVSVTADPEPGGAVASTSARQDTHRVELTPLPGLTQQFAIQVEQEIQKQIQDTQPPVSPRCTAEVRQPDNAPDPFGGSTGPPSASASKKLWPHPRLSWHHPRNNLGGRQKGNRPSIHWPTHLLESTCPHQKS